MCDRMTNGSRPVLLVGRDRVPSAYSGKYANLFRTRGERNPGLWRAAAGTADLARRGFARSRFSAIGAKHPGPRRESDGANHPGWPPDGRAIKQAAVLSTPCLLLESAFCRKGVRDAHRRALDSHRDVERWSLGVRANWRWTCKAGLSPSNFSMPCSRPRMSTKHDAKAVGRWPRVRGGVAVGWGTQTPT
jgi:hypothetical protein